MDQENQAVASQLIVPPALLAAAGEDPKVASAVARKMHLVTLHLMHQQMRNPNIPAGQRLQYLDHLAKVGGVYASPTAPVQAAAGQGFGVNIIFSSDSPPPKVEITQTTTQPAADVVDVKATETTAPAPANKLMANVSFDDAD